LAGRPWASGSCGSTPAQQAPSSRRRPFAMPRRGAR
jgi:hypothetical protein